jgi:hypothetical protein
MLLPPGAVEFYDQTGWYVSDYTIPESELDACIAAAERIYRGEFDATHPWSFDPILGDTVRPYVDRSRLRVDQFPSFHSEVIRRVVHSPAIAAMCAQLLHTSEVRYYKDILIGVPNEAKESSIGWHVDVSYWPTCVPERMITIYVPLQDRVESNGTLLMISGSHRWGLRNFNLTIRFDQVERLKARLESDGREVQLQPLPHRRGQVSFHSSLVVHATYPNVTPQFQHSVVFGLQAADNRFVPSPLKRFNCKAVINLNDEIGPKLADGVPDIKNDSFYPVLYRDPEAG